jgi:hypothetical protein
MSDHHLMGPFVRRFLIEELVTDRNLSPNTQKATATRSVYSSTSLRSATRLTLHAPPLSRLMLR